jgi:hypothetical protein
MAGLCAFPYRRFDVALAGDLSARGRCGSLFTHRLGLTPTTSCGLSGALRKMLGTTNRRNQRMGPPSEKPSIQSLVAKLRQRYWAQGIHRRLVDAVKSGAVGG